MLAAEAGSLTVRNISSSQRARLGTGPTRDVVLIDGELDRIVGVQDAAAEDMVRSYAD